MTKRRPMDLKANTANGRSAQSPKLVLLCGAGRLPGSGDRLDGIAQAADEPAHPLWVKRRQDAGGPTAPVVPGQHGLGEAQRIHQVENIKSQGRLLARARRVGTQKPGLAKTAQPRHNYPATRLCQAGTHCCIGMDVIRKAMQQQHRRASGWAPFLVGDLQRAGLDAVNCRDLMQEGIHALS